MTNFCSTFAAARRSEQSGKQTSAQLAFCRPARGNNGGFGEQARRILLNEFPLQ